MKQRSPRRPPSGQGYIVADERDVDLAEEDEADEEAEEDFEEEEAEDETDDDWEDEEPEEEFDLNEEDERESRRKAKAERKRS